MREKPSQTGARLHLPTALSLYLAQAVSLKEVIEEWLQSIASRHDLL